MLLKKYNSEGINFKNIIKVFLATLNFKCYQKNFLFVPLRIPKSETLSQNRFHAPLLRYYCCYLYYKKTY